MQLVQSVAFNYPVLMVRSSDHVTGAPGVALTIRLSKNGGAFTLISPQVIDQGFGDYSVHLLPEHTDTVGSFQLHVEADGCDPFDSNDQVLAATTLLIPSIAPTSIINTIKGIIGIDEDDTSQDVKLAELIRFAVAVVQGKTKRYFGQPASRTEYHVGPDRDKFVLEGYIDDSPAANASDDPTLNPSTSLVISRRTRGSGGDWEDLVEGTDWERRKRQIIALNPFVWWPSCDELRCVYLDGYVDAPDDIDRVIVEIAVSQYMTDLAAGTGTLGVTSEKLGDFSYTLDSSVSQFDYNVLSSFGRQTLERYRRRFV